MKKRYSTVLLALIALFALSNGARAQEKGVVAKVSHEFVAGGKTFPPGTYTIGRVTSDTQPVLKIRNNETSQHGAFLLPVSSADGVDRSGLTFERVGDTYYLSRISTNLGVYTVRKPTAMTDVAKIKSHNGMSSAGTK
jgi:hypothetical protein